MEVGCVLELILLIQVLRTLQWILLLVDSEPTRRDKSDGAGGDGDDAMSLFLLHGAGGVRGRGRRWLW